MGDLTKGVTFTAGATVTHTSLNNLVDDATIKAEAVTGAKIAPGTITADKLAASLTFGASHIGLVEGAVIVGGASDVGVEVSLNTAQFEVASSTLRLKDLGVTNDKLAGSIATAKLAGSIDSSKLTAVGTAGTYGSASLVPVITTDVAGRVTAVTTAACAPTITTKTLAIPAAGAATTDTVAAAPVSAEAWMKCTSTDAGWSVDDLVSLSSFADSSERCALAAYCSGTTVGVRRSNSSTFRVIRKDTGAYDDADPSKWQVLLRIR